MDYLEKESWRRTENEVSFLEGPSYCYDVWVLS